MNAFLAPAPGPSSRSVRTAVRFALVALLFYAIDGTIAHSQLFLDRVEVLGPVVAVDLTFGLTLAWWLIVVRAKRASARSVVAVFVLAIAGAAVTLPAGHRDVLRDFRYLAIPFELALIVGIVVAVRRASRQLAAEGATLDVPERIRAVLAESIPARVADVVAMESAILYYAFASWRRRPFAPAEAVAFTSYRKTGFLGILYTAAGLSVVEVLIVDLVLRTRHPLTANVLLVVGVFGGVWLLGFARAVQLRPILLDRETLRLRMGLQWAIDIPRANIQLVEFDRARIPADKRTPGYLRLVTQPNVLITLREQQLVRGPYGVRRSVQRVAFAIDDTKKFRQHFND
jgi:hypothetical protein